MKRAEILWLAFEKFAVFFSFMVTFILVMVLLVLAYAAWRSAPMLIALKDGWGCETLTSVNQLLDDLNSAVITRTIYISQTIPVQFTLDVEKNLDVTLMQGVRLRRPATFVLPAGGGQINGNVSMVLPEGLALPVHLRMKVPVDQQLPVRMAVPVSIPLSETDLGPIFGKLVELLEPLRLKELEKTLGCTP